MNRIRAAAIGVLCVFVLVAVSGCAGKRISAKQEKEAEAYYYKGLSFMRKGQPYDALANIKKAIELNPDDPRFYDAAGLLYFATGRFDKAEEAYKKALELDPKYSDARHNLGVLYNRLGRYDEAIEQFKIALADDTYRNRANTYNAMGWAYFKKKEYDEAEKAFMETIRHDRMYLMAYDNLGKVYIAKGEYEKAVEVLETIKRLERELGLKKGMPAARLDLGIAYLKLGKKEQAKLEFERALALDPYGPIGKQAKKYLELLK